jgi:predicted DNA-binding ribbon-helix-helix protein
MIDRREVRNDTRFQQCSAEPGEDQIVTGLSLRNLVVDGRRTSVKLEPLLWDALRDIARRREMTVHKLATEIAMQRTLSNLTAAIRVYIVGFYRTATNQYSGTSVADRS